VSNQDKGKKGEEAAARFLVQNRYRIIARNYRTSCGEVDIIARDGDTICFVEVKGRSSDRFGLPQEALSVAKQKKIVRVALFFLKEKKLLEAPARFDVVTVLFDEEPWRVELIKNAFEL
jgi:putative endonuclease